MSFPGKNSFLHRVVSASFRNRIPSAAAETAYYLVFAFFPLIMIVYSSFSIFLKSFDWQSTLFFVLLPNELQSLVAGYIESISRSEYSLSYLLIGILLTLYTLSNFMRSMKRTIRHIYGSGDYASFLSEVGVSLVFSLLIIIAFYVTLILLILGGQIISLINEFLAFIHLPPDFRVEELTRLLITAALIFFIVSLFYFWIPNVKQTMSDILPGTIFTSVTWVVVSGLFSFYMNHFANYSLIYGSIGAFIMLLLWIYVACLLLLIGAVINSVLYHKRHATGKDDMHAGLQNTTEHGS